MSSNDRLLRKLRRVMGAAVTLPSLVACSSQISCAINENLNFQINDSDLYVEGYGEISQEDVRNAIDTDLLTSIKSIHILDERVTIVKEKAFEGCKNLKNVEFHRGIVIEKDGFGTGFRWAMLIEDWYFPGQANCVIKLVNRYNCD